MKRCEYCNAELPDESRFCGNCGSVLNVPDDGQTRVNPWNTQLEVDVAPVYETPTGPLIDEDEDEEKRKRAALLGMGLIGLEALPQGSGVPMVQGTPQLNAVPAVQGVPQLPGGASQGGALQVAPHVPPAPVPAPVTPAPSMPSTSTPTLTLPTHHPSSGSPSSPGSSGSSGPSPHHGCAPALIISAIIIPLIIIASIIGLGLTILAPSLSLSGSGSVTSGGTLPLHGSHFAPGSSITLALDGATPLFVIDRQSRMAAHAQQLARSLRLTSAQVYVPATGNSTISAGSDGTFNVTITIDPSWSTGQHTIVANEAVTHRSASLSFTILAATSSPTATGTVTPTPIKTTTVTPTATSSAPSTQPGLSCINPSTVSLGPVSEYYAQAVTSSVTLCANGSGAVRWTASWDMNKAFWLSLQNTSGQINAPGDVQIALSASAAQLGPGNYKATITFSSSSSSAVETLTVSFAVQQGCLKGSPGTLSFSGVANVSDAPTQTVALTNCGATGTWSASATTTDGANWLSASPTGNTIDGGGASPENVTITTSNLTAQLKAGTYNGSVTFSIGSGSFTLQVTLTVQPAPVLSANTQSLTGSADCTSNNSTYLCYVTLTNNSKSTSLTWTYSENLIPSLVVKPASFTLAPGGFERVPLSISVKDCSSGASITFTGPANSVNVAWQCYYPIG